MRRMIAFFALFIPGALAVYGIKLMRDTLFGILQFPWPALLLQFFFGLVFCIGGIAFVAGFILHRDRKKKKVTTRFNNTDKQKKV